MIRGTAVNAWTRRGGWRRPAQTEPSDSNPPALRLTRAAQPARSSASGPPRNGWILDLALAAVLGVLASALYLRTLAPGLLGGDSGEFQFAAWLGGFVHPTGYPLYLLLGYLWSHIVGLLTPAWRMNAFSALWGGVAVGLTYLLTVRILSAAASSRIAHGDRSAILGRATRTIAGSAVAAIFAVSPTFWSQSVVAEVYTLHAVFFAAVLLGLVTWVAQPQPMTFYRPLYWTALVYGLSLTHHRTMLLLAPVIAFLLWRERRGEEAWSMGFGGVVRAALLVLLPCLLYLLIPLRAPHVSYAQVALSPTHTLTLYAPTLTGFIDNATGRAFSTEIRTLTEAWGQIPVAAGQFAAELSYPVLFLSLVGLLWLARRSRPIAGLTAFTFLVVTVFNLFYGIGDIYVYYIPTYLLCAVWAGAGVMAIGDGCDATIRRLSRSASDGDRRPPAVASCDWVSLGLAVSMIAIPWSLGVGRFARLDQSRNVGAQTTWELLLSQPIPDAALLVSNDRDEMTALWYLQYVEGVRTDLVGLFPEIVPGSEWSDVGQVIASALKSERSVLLIKEMPGLEVKYRLAPLGALVVVEGLAVEKTPSRPTDTVFGNSIRLVGYDVDPAQVPPGGRMRVSLYWQPLRGMSEDYATFVHLVDSTGEVVGQSDHRPGGSYYPSSLWRPGELVLDVHELELLTSAGVAPYDLEVGLYTNAGQISHLGSPQRIGQLAPARASDVVPTNLSHPVDREFGDQIVLRGYDSNIADHQLTLHIYWQAMRQPDASYTRFVHFVAGDGSILAQNDEVPDHGQLPTTTWPHGYVFADEIRIDLPDDLAAGSYQVDVGFYDAITGIRLQVQGADGAFVGDSLVLMDLTWPPR